MCIDQCSVVTNLINSQKSEYYTSVINEHSGDQRVLFKTVNKLLQRSSVKRYPPSPDNISLANSFADFFTSKIDKIHCALTEKQVTMGPAPVISSECCAELSNFAEVNLDEVRKYAIKPSSKSCNLDPLPASVSGIHYQKTLDVLIL